MFSGFAFPGSVTTFPNGINDAGVIVGNYQDPSFHFHGFVKTGSIFTTVDAPGTLDTRLNGINASGQMVGTINNTLSTIRGFLDVGGVFTPIVVPTAKFGTAPRGINASGTVVGQYTDAVLRRGFLFTGGSFFSIDITGALETDAFGINPAGDIVGAYVDVAGHNNGFLYDAGTFYQLDFPGAFNTELGGINDSGTIIGDYQLAFPAPFHGLRAVLGDGPALSPINGTITPIPSPVPEPATVFLLALGLAVVGSVTLCRWWIDRRPAGVDLSGSLR